MVSSASVKSPGASVLRWGLRLFLLILVLLLGAVTFLYLQQHAMIYHPRPYASDYARLLRPNGVEIHYRLPVGEQTAFYLPAGSDRPRHIWLAFCGNGSLALDWVTILHPNHEDAFLLIDYPGYGKNSGYATMETTRASSEAALRALRERLKPDEKTIPLGVIGHSLGAAVALDFAAHHAVARVVLIAPFTTLREEAATVVGRSLANLLVENYDNRAALRSLTQLSPPPVVEIFHGTHDDVIPFRMGRQLAQDFPTITHFHPVAGADHVSVLDSAADEIRAAMNP